MSDRINLSQRVSTLDKAPQFDSYSKVIINIDEETQVSAGNAFGRTLEFDNPFGTQAMANQILAKLRGFQYQPYSSSGALLDPAAEIGDAISIKDVYGGLYTRVRTFSRLMKADISAPYDEEINHEYKFESPEQRKFKREMGDVRATLSIESDRITAEVAQREADSTEFRSQLNIQSTEIAARVTKTGNVSNTFAWSLDSDGFYINDAPITASVKQNKSAKFSFTNTGLKIRGDITATSGKIGNFNIGNTAIWNNISKFRNTSPTTGVYLGTDGIQLGQRFFVDTYGNVTANNLTINGGSIKLGGTAQNPVFQVSTSGAVTASNLILNGGSINLGNGVFQVSSSGAVTATNIQVQGGAIAIGGNFYVDPQGNLYANSGTFRGAVSAGNIQYGGSYGTFNAGGLTDYSIGAGKYANYSIGSDALGGGSVINRTIGGSAVSYGKVDFTGTLDQVGINTSDINGLSARVASVEAGYFNSISTNSIAFGDYYFYVSNGYVRAAPIG